MKVARYMGSGSIAIVAEPEPACPAGGLLVKTEASGLCSGELMDWYMDRKIPHVLGHEVAGVVVESQDSRFPVGCRVAPHHHAPCMSCELCRRGAYVHCEQWKRTKLLPGGMAEFFAVSAENLTDCHALGQLESAELRSVDAALMEPLACVVKSLTRAGNHDRVAVIGLGVMGLLHALLVPTAVGVDLNPKRRNWASEHGLDARESAGPGAFDLVIVCPGTETALTSAIELCAPGATIVLFSPFGPPGQAILPVDTLYFNDINLITSYSCGPVDTATALELFKQDKLRAEQVVSHFISIDELPNAYQSMKRGDILKPMVIF